VSARDAYANREQAPQAGAKAFLQKPVNNDELLAIIGRYVKKTAASVHESS
jgi:CheY-like chemotaxis protein